MSDTASLTNRELELTQKIQLHFPRGKIHPEILRAWISLPKHVLTERLQRVFSESPVVVDTQAVTGSQSQGRWREQDGIIYFSVTSDGTTGEEWITRLRRRRFKLRNEVVSMLRSKEEFTPTSGVTTTVAVLRHSLFGGGHLSTKRICAFAADHGLEIPNAEVACLIRELLSNGEIGAMGLKSIVAMHKPFKHTGHLYLFGADDIESDRDSYQSFSSFNYEPDVGWVRECEFGFAFAVPAGVNRP